MVLGHADSKSGLQFYLRATLQRLRMGFKPKFGSIPDLPAVIYVAIIRLNIIIVCITHTNRTPFFLKTPDPELTYVFPARHNTNILSGFGLIFDGNIV